MRACILDLYDDTSCVCISYAYLNPFQIAYLVILDVDLTGYVSFTFMEMDNLDYNLEVIIYHNDILPI
jgi:hypothetical protein